MNKNKLKILILEDNPDDAQLMVNELEKEQYEINWKRVETKKNFINAICDFKPDIILSDYSLPQFTGFEALEIAKKLVPDIPFIIVTGTLSEEMAADSIISGAWDYVLKENLLRLTPAIKNVLKLEKEKDKNKLAEEALKISEEKHRTLIETTSEGFWLLNPEKKTIDVNQSLCDMLGYSRNEMIGKTPFDFVDEKNRKIFKDQTSQITNTLHRTYEISLKKKSGINFPTLFNATSLVDKNGNPAGSFALVTDITENKQAKEKLLKTRERLELAMDAGEHGFWDWNLDTNDIYFSPRYYTMLGYKPGELPMKLETWVDLMHPDDRKTIVAEVENYVKNAQSYEVEFRLKTKNGDWKWISGRGKSYKKDKNGIPHRAVGVHVDITERKQAEEALKESEEKYRNLIERANDGICIIQDGVITFTNPRLAELWGGTNEEIIGTPFTNYVHPDELSKLADYYNRRLKGERVPTLYETALMKKSGDKIYVELSAGIITYQGKPADLIIVRDITYRRQSEEALKKRMNELEIFNEATVDREIKMLELKKEINDMLVKLGEKSKYEIPV